MTQEQIQRLKKQIEIFKDPKIFNPSQVKIGNKFQVRLYDGNPIQSRTYLMMGEYDSAQFATRVVGEMANFLAAETKKYEQALQAHLDKVMPK